MDGIKFYQWFVARCAFLGKRPATVAREIPISKSIITRWKKGEGNPTDATIEKILRYFGCSAEDLENPVITQPALTNEDGLSEKDARLIAWFRSLPVEKQKAILISQDAPEGLV